MLKATFLQTPTATRSHMISITSWLSTEQGFDSRRDDSRHKTTYGGSVLRQDTQVKTRFQVRFLALGLGLKLGLRLLQRRI